MKALRVRGVFAGTFALLFAGALVFGRDQQAELKLTPVAGQISCLFGRGGNIGVSAGSDGVLIVDDQFLDLAPEIEKTLKGFGKGEPAFVVNTHWHGDHTGGNEHFGKKAIIIAHANVRRRLARDPAVGGNVSEKEVPLPALPEITYDDGAAIHFAIHFNGEEVRLIHVPGAHTDGDTVVWFTKSNVVHLGDLYFEVGYPFIDTASGGGVEGLLAGLRELLAKLPRDARFIPGHGEVTGIEGLEEYLAMIDTISQRVREHLKEGWSVDEMVSSGVTEDFDARWGNFAFVPPWRFVEILAESLQK